MIRLGLAYRIMLVLVGTAVALSASSLLLLRWQAAHAVRSGPFLRVQQLAADVDLLGAVPVDIQPTVLHALPNRLLRLALVDRPPPLAGLIPAPRLQAHFRGYARSAAAGAARVYTSPDQARRDRRDGVEGFLALGLAPLPGGRWLVATPVLDGDPPRRGAPAFLWIGLCGGLVAAVAALLAWREMRPLRRLASSLEAFDMDMATVPRGAAPELHALAAAVGSMQRRVAELTRERTVTMAAVSHDLRTLLTRLRLRVLTAPAGLRTGLEADLDAMDALVADAMAFARGTDVALVSTRVDLADVVATELAEREACGAPAAAAELASGWLRGDWDALRRVVANLLDNAARYGRGQIAVDVGTVAGRVELAVADDGPGIPAGEQDQVLRPFYRLETSRNRGTGGAGLGLAIVGRIVAAHGGTVTIARSPLGGALVRVTFPVAEAGS